MTIRFFVTLLFSAFAAISPTQANDRRGQELEICSEEAMSVYIALPTSTETMEHYLVTRVDILNNGCTVVDAPYLYGHFYLSYGNHVQVSTASMRLCTTEELLPYVYMPGMPGKKVRAMIQIAVPL